jgi:uncharacterized BrkB/YihY/UPF0761 family membrane protein
MHDRMSDEELAEYFRRLYGKKCERKEIREARGRMRLAAFVAVIGLIVLVAVVICGVLFITRTPAHAAEIVPSWSPERTKAGDWLAIYYIFGLLLFGGVVGIFRFLFKVD